METNIITDLIKNEENNLNDSVSNSIFRIEEDIHKLKEYLDLNIRDNSNIISDEEVYFLMNNKKIHNHFMLKKPIYLRILYFRFIANIYNISNTDEKKKEAKYFLTRLGVSIDLDKDEIINYLKTPEDSIYKINELWITLSDKEIINLCVDMLLASIQFDYTEKQVIKWLSKWMSIFVIDPDKIELIIKIVNSIIEEDINKLLSLYNKYDVNYVIGYITNKDTVITDELNLTDNEEVIFINKSINGSINNINNIDIKCKTIRFYNCLFNGRDSFDLLSGLNFKVILNNCHFIDDISIFNFCRDSIDYPINLNNAEIENCKFIEISDINGLLNIDKGFIKNSVFERCATNGKNKLLNVKEEFNNKFIECKDA